MMENGSWNGGYVNGWGYVAPESTCNGNSRNVTTFNNNSIQYVPAEGVGFNGSFSVSGYTIIQNGKITVAANNQCVGVDSSQLKSSACANIIVNGIIVATQSLVLSGQAFTQQGVFPLGSTTFDLTQYTGHVQVQIVVSNQYNSGVGYTAANYKGIVYNNYRIH